MLRSLGRAVSFTVSRKLPLTLEHRVLSSKERSSHDLQRWSSTAPRAPSVLNPRPYITQPAPRSKHDARIVKEPGTRYDQFREKNVGKGTLFLSPG